MKLFRIPLALALLAGASPAWAQLITTNPLLPPLPPELPATGGYLSDAPAAQYLFPPASSLLLNQSMLRPLSLISRIPLGPDERESFTVSLDGTASLNGNPATPFSIGGQALTQTFNKIGFTTGTFNTEMLQLDLSGIVAGGPVMIRESPTLASFGQTTITDIGGGLFRIDSFFDVFTELSIDGGQSWVPDSQGPTRLTLVSDVPEASTVAVGLMLAGVTAAGWYRRRSPRKS
jgi:hypothetical protein